MISFNLFLTLLCIKSAYSIQDYCSSNNFNDSGDDGGMQFTKEAPNREFAIMGKFKGLHCCAKGYKSIEWEKDGKPYPWALGLSGMIVLPESANQTIYTQKVTEDDNGNYTCILHDGKNKYTMHSINLEVFDKLPDDPKITYVSDDKEIVEGEKNVRLFCEAFAGRIPDLPDALNEAVWRRVYRNGSQLEVPDRLRQEKIGREENQTFGTLLIFPVMTKEDYGTYTCIISKPGNTIQRTVEIREKIKVIEYIDPNPFPVKEFLCLSIGFVLIAIALLICYKKYGLKLQVYVKDSLATSEGNDGRQNDVLVVYAPKDAELVLGVLLPTLENKLGYRCASRELGCDISSWSADLSHPAQTARRLLTIISPSALNDSWSSSNLYQALKQIQLVTTSKAICIALKELPVTENETKNSIGETLASLAKSMRVILWERSKDDKFWLSLRKDLPPRRRTDTLNETEMKHQQPSVRNNDIIRLNSISSDCSHDSFMV